MYIHYKTIRYLTLNDILNNVNMFTLYVYHIYNVLFVVYHCVLYLFRTYSVIDLKHHIFLKLQPIISQKN